MVIAIYAHYSSDLQNPKSADDQIKLCRRYVEAHYDRAIVIIPFKDEAISRKTLNHPGLQSLLNIVKKKRVRVVGRLQGYDERNVYQGHDREGQTWTDGEGEGSTLLTMYRTMLSAT